MDINYKMHAMNNGLHDVPQMASTLLGIHKSELYSVLNKGLSPEPRPIFTIKGLSLVAQTNRPHHIHGD